VRHAEQPTLRGLDLLARGTAEEKTEEGLLQCVVGRLTVARQRAGIAKDTGGLPLVKVRDLLLDSRRERAAGTAIHR